MRAPHFWSAGLDPRSRAAAPLTRAVLTPLASAWAMVTARRIAQGRSASSPVPVICVGNLTAGGSGKTPVVAALRQACAARGLVAASLSRGHGGRLAGPLRVSADVHRARDVGDEPLMLAAGGEAWIARDRAAGAAAMARAGVGLILMDDGHQNTDLRKDLSLVVIDAAAPFGNGHVIPKGPLREPVAAGLARADAVILMGEGPVPEPVLASGVAVYRARLVRRTALPAGPLVAFAGIARPDRFFAALEKDGAELRDAVGYGDHHVFRPADLAFVRSLAEAHGASLVTTEKDFARLPADRRRGITAICAEAVFDDPGDPGRLLAPILARQAA